MVGEAPLILGQEFEVGEGKYNLTTLKFFLAEPTLTTEDGSLVPAQFVSQKGDPTPYNVVLVDAEQESSLALSIAAPPGSYAGLTLGLGLPAPCNASDPTLATYPLSLDADMFWAWGTQYMFQRVHGKAWVDESWQSLVYDVGFDASYRTIHLNYALGPDSGAPPARLAFDASAFFDAPPGEEILLMNHALAPEWILQNLATEAFSLAPAEPLP